MIRHVITWAVLFILVSPVIGNDNTFGLGDPERVNESRPSLFGLDTASGVVESSLAFETVIIGYEQRTVCENGFCRQVSVPIYGNEVSTNRANAPVRSVERSTTVTRTRMGSSGPRWKVDGATVLGHLVRDHGVPWARAILMTPAARRRLHDELHNTGQVWQPRRWFGWRR